MTLLELSEPLFQYICRLNRSARKGGNYELGQVQSEVKALLAEAKAASVGENLSDQFEKIELPLMFFCDFMIKESALPWARDWKELAFDRHGATFDPDTGDRRLSSEGLAEARRFLAERFPALGDAPLTAPVDDARSASTTHDAVYVFVAATARSGPQRSANVASAVRARRERAAFVMAIVNAPLRRAAATTAATSGELPDCEMPIAAPPS